MKPFKCYLKKKKKIICVISTCIITMSFSLFLNYNRMYGNLQRFIAIPLTSTLSSTEILEIVNLNYNGSENFLINTPGCFIPNYAKKFNFKEAKVIKKSCGERAIFLEKLSDEHFIARINEEKMKIYTKEVKHYECCYQFIIPDKKDYTKLRYSNCELLTNGAKIKIEEEIVAINCVNQKQKKQIIYRDIYVLVKRDTQKKTDQPKPWNLLIIGMDTMSRARHIQSMPETVKYLQQHNWLDFRAYQKIGYNTFPNVMAFLTGKNLSEVHRACTNGMDKCNDMMLWSHFKKAGYFTATGEDYLRLPDTFTKYNGYKIRPTDHYLRPFFLTGEDMVGNFICTKKKPSAEHLLDYAYDFSKSYMNDNYFGMFWINSFSHNLQNVPSLIDKYIVEFFKSLNKTGVLNNTFVFFLSDHGIRYGEMRLPYESYYEERLPMLYTWVPPKFREKHNQMYKNLLTNQNRLITPYDVYITMMSISETFENSDFKPTAESCPKCSSMFNEFSQHRTCGDVNVPEKWCSCFDVVEADINDPIVLHALKIAVEDLQEKVKKIKTVPCMVCQNLTLKSMIRAHEYKETENKTIFILAFKLKPGDVLYEANIEHDGGQFRVINPTETISTYNTRGNCVENPNDRAFCVCKKQLKCKIKTI